MSNMTILEWTYSPAEYFEEPVTFSKDCCQVTIQNGNIEARLTTEDFEKSPDIAKSLEASLNRRFQGTQLLTHKAYELSFSGRRCVHPDGQKDVFITPQVSRIALDAIIADIVVTRTDGSVYDSKKEASKAAELDLCVQAGEIAFYLRQVPFDLGAGVKYVADFVTFKNVYDHNDGPAYLTKVIEVKMWRKATSKHPAGFFYTPEAKLKMKLFKEKYPDLELEICK